jgi:hypothetical protein
METSFSLPEEMEKLNPWVGTGNVGQYRHF